MIAEGMELPLEQVVDAIATLRQLHEQSGHERRYLPRFPVWAPCTIQVTGGGGAAENLDVWLIDLSSGGLGMISSRDLPVEQEFHISLPAAESGGLNALCKVVHSWRRPSGSYAVGARFSMLLAADAVTTAAALPTAAAAARESA